MSNESQPTPQEQFVLKSQIEKIDKWDFNKSAPDLTRKFLSDLLTEIREVYNLNNWAWINISETLLPDEIKAELVEPYGGRISILLGKGSEEVPVKEDRGKPAVLVEGAGSSGAYDVWGLIFVIDDNSTRVRNISTAGPNSINAIGFEKKYKTYERALLKIIGKLTKASLITQSASPQVLN